MIFYTFCAIFRVMRNNDKRLPELCGTFPQQPQGSAIFSIMQACFPQKTNNPNPSPIGNKFGSSLFGPSGENRTHGLLNPIVLLAKTQWTLRYHLYAVSSNFKLILSFCFVRCQDVSFLLWSNCGQPTPTNDLSPLLSYMAQFRFFKIEIALFCLHELFIRRICQPCQ